MTALFWILAAGLTAAGIAFLVLPLVREAPASRVNRRSEVLAAHRDRLLEIEREESDDACASAETDRESRVDVARALLRDIEADDSSAGTIPPPPCRRPRHAAAITLGIALAGLAVALYSWLGEPGALQSSNARSSPGYPAAVAAEVERVLREAETIGRANGNRLEGEPARLVERALILAPDHRKALWFAAVAALHEDRAEDARARLERLRELGPLDETEIGMFEQLMAEVRARRADG